MPGVCWPPNVYDGKTGQNSSVDIDLFRLLADLTADCKASGALDSHFPFEDYVGDYLRSRLSLKGPTPGEL